MRQNVFTSNEVSQNMLISQARLDALELKKDESTDYVLSWKSKGAYTSKRKTLCTASLHKIKLSG